MENKESIRNLGKQIRRSHIAIDRYFSSSWKQVGMELTRMQCATIRYLVGREGENVFQKDLEKEFSITGATASNILKVMEKEELIIRVPMEQDGRLKRILLTEKGIELNRKGHDNVKRLENGMKKGFTEEELELFHDFLDRMTQNVMELIEEKED